MRQHVTPGVHRRYGRISGQRNPEGLHKACHRRGGTHGHAMPRGTTHSCFHFHEFTDTHLTRTYGFTELPDIRPRSNVLAAELAVEHGAARYNDCWQITTGRSHQQGRCSLVAPGKQHNPVDRIGANRFLHVHTHQVPEQHGGWSHQRFAQRHHRELDRESAGLIDSTFHPLSDFSEMSVTRCQI